MSDIEREILTALRGMEEAVRIMGAGGPKTNLVPVFERIGALTRALPTGTSPDLLHYLHKQSYEKARLWLEGREGENQAGACRH